MHSSRFTLCCQEWKRLAPQHLALPPAGPLFYAQVFHPAFNLDLDEAEDTLDRFDSHTRAAGKGVQALRNIFGKVREARIGVFSLSVSLIFYTIDSRVAEMSKAERLLSYSLLSLITSKPLAAAPTTGISDEDGSYSDKAKGLMNSDGAWCWRERCDRELSAVPNSTDSSAALTSESPIPACLKLTKAMQKTCDTLQIVADLYDDHVSIRLSLQRCDCRNGLLTNGPAFLHCRLDERSLLLTSRSKAWPIHSRYTK